MKYEFMIFVLIIISFSAIPQINAEDKPNLIKSNEAISIISTIPPTKYPQFELELINIGNGTGIVTNTITSNFALKEETNFSVLESEIGKSDIIEKMIPKKIEPGVNPVKFVWELIEFKWDEGTYTGKIIVNGTNFEPVTVNASVTYVVSSWLIFSFNLLGIGLAILLGKKLQNIERDSKEIGRYQDCSLALKLVEKLIAEINEFKMEIPQNRWEKLQSIANKRIIDMEKLTMKFEVTKDSDNVKWFLKTHQSVIGICCGEGSTSNKSMNAPDVQKWLEKAVEFQTEKNRVKGKDEIREEIKEKLVARDTSKNKKIFLIVTTIFSSVTSIFVLDSVTGPFWMNVLVAIGLGFGVYRAQDFQKWFKKDSK